MNFAGLIWDLPGDCPHFEGLVLHWRSLAPPGGGISIPAYLETHAVSIRQKYLAFVYELGELQVAGQTVSQHLQDDAGNNFWWMGLIAEKSPFKTPEIYQALRLLALEQQLISAPPCTLELRSNDVGLAASIKALCLRLRIPFTCKLQPRTGGALLQRLRQSKLWADWLQASLFVLLYIWRRWALSRIRPLQWHQGDNAVFFGSYFAHLDLAAVRQGRFESRQWGALPDLLVQNGLRLNWLQNYWPGDAADNSTVALALARRFNLAASLQGVHGFVDAYLSAQVVGRALRSWLFLSRKAQTLHKLPDCLLASGNAAYLWPVLQPAWRSSLKGRVAIANCLNVHLFDAAMRDMPRQSRGYYLFENQGWEKAFLTAWRRHGHGSITGVVHSTVPFWHLYYAEDPRSLEPGMQPQPDAIVVNGPVARQALLDQGYRANRLVAAEALRYQGLVQASSEVAGAGLDLSNGRRILIVGDMERDTLLALLTTVQKAQRMLPACFHFAFKPHPAFHLDPKQSVGLDVPVVGGALAGLLNSYDCVLAGNSTSASVDAFLAGKPVIIACSGSHLNLSPLRGQPGVTFFESPQQLVESLLGGGSRLGHSGRLNEYFYLEDDLTQWRKLLGLPTFANGAVAINVDGSDGVVSEQSI